MAKKKCEPKESFKMHAKYEAVYTGGRLQFSKDGQYFLSLCHEKLKKFHIATGATEDAVDNVDELTCFLLAEDDETLITAAKSGVLRLWEFSTKTLKRTWKTLHIGPVSCMAFDPSTTLLATGGSDSAIKIWDIERKYYTHNLKGGTGVVSKICFKMLQSEFHVFATSDDYIIRVWNLHSGNTVALLEGHYSTITDLVFQDDKTMLSSSRDKVVLVWDLSNFSLKKTISIFESVEACILAPDDLQLSDIPLNSEEKYFITAGDKGILKVWSSSSGKCVYTQTDSPVVLPEDSSNEGSLITQGMFIPALNAIGITTFEHNIILYSLENFSLKKQFIGYNDDILSMKFMGSSDSHLAVATNSSQIKVFEFPHFSCQLLKGHLDIVLAVDVFPKHPNILVSGSKDNSIKVWIMNKDSKILNCVYTGYGHTDSVSAVSCCRGKSLIFASGSHDTTLKMWEIPEKKPLVALKLLLAPYCTIKAHDKLINSIDMSENDKLVATGSQDHTAKIWDATNLTLLGTLRGHKKGVWSVNFSPIDLVIATSSGDETIIIWSLTDFSRLKVFQGHEATVLQVQFLSRGTQLISSASDGNIKLWDIKHHICINTLDEGHSGRVWTLTSTSSEDYIVSGGADSNIIIWEDTTGHEKELKSAEKEEFVKKEQKLANLVHEKKWTKALGLAITLDKPFLAYNIIQELLLQEDGHLVFQEVFSELRQDQREAILKFSVEWNTHAKTCLPAVTIIKLFLQTHDIQELLKIPSISTYIRDLLPYIDRHDRRLDRCWQDMQILNLLCQQFKITGISGLEEKEKPKSIVEDVDVMTKKRIGEIADQEGKKMKFDIH